MGPGGTLCWGADPSAPDSLPPSVQTPDSIGFHHHPRPTTAKRDCPHQPNAVQQWPLGRGPGRPLLTLALSSPSLPDDFKLLQAAAQPRGGGRNPGIPVRFGSTRGKQSARFLIGHLLPCRVSKSPPWPVAPAGALARVTKGSSLKSLDSRPASRFGCIPPGCRHFSKLPGRLFRRAAGLVSTREGLSSTPRLTSRWKV